MPRLLQAAPLTTGEVLRGVRYGGLNRLHAPPHAPRGRYPAACYHEGKR